MQVSLCIERGIWVVKYDLYRKVAGKCKACFDNDCR